MELTYQRCLIHVDRQAIARCPECANYFCRECITEHEGKFLCSNCLGRTTSSSVSTPPTAGWLMVALGAIGGLAVAWTFFYLIGRLLILIPSNLHDLSYLKHLG
jgi:hypothetical protein